MPDGDAGLETVHLDSWGLEGDSKLERLDIMKVDTEGMELRVLESAAGAHRALPSGDHDGNQCCAFGPGWR